MSKRHYRDPLPSFFFFSFTCTLDDNVPWLRW
ncbi:ORFL311W [Human betaherpesvirus 5]|nr:ORFL311W [Human betaherpesvirus 5]